MFFKQLTSITFLFLLFLIQFIGCKTTEKPSDHLYEINEPLRVMTFNIRFDNPDDGPDARLHRKDFVASMFRFYQNDILGIQEGLVNQVKELDEMLPEFGWVGIGRDDGEEAGEFCAIYYKIERFDLIDNGTFWLSDTPDIPGSMGWDAAITRIATWARFNDKKNNRRFIVFNTHYDHRWREVPGKSSELILQKIDELAKGDPVVLMGDMNAVESQNPYKILADSELGPVRVDLFDGFYHSSFGHHGPASTSNGFREIRSNRRIDYIFVNPKFSVIQHGILADIRDGHFPSDHLPVVADIEFNS